MHKLKFMKKVIYFFLSVIALSSCFRPEETPQKSRHELLCGYWETDYIDDDDYWYEIYMDGTFGQTYTYNFQGHISPNDGNEEYAVIYFDRSTVRLIATDCPDDAEMIGKVLKYDFVDDCLYGTAFTFDHTNFAKLKRVDDMYLELYIDDTGTSFKEVSGSNGDNPVVGIYENMKRTIKYRRIQ